MSALNFCSSVFKTTVTSDKVTVDGYEATNLVTSTPSMSTSSGFLVENFVRSPATITFEFAFNIEIEKVVIHGVVGSQRSCGYELFTRTQPRSGKALVEKGDAQYSKSDSSAVKNFDEGLFYSVGKFNNLEAETFTFKNNRYRYRRPFSELIRMRERPFDDSKHADVEFRTRNVINLIRVSHLAIKVNRVVPGCVAAVRWVEIWGQPAVSTSPDIVSMILYIHAAMIKDNSKASSLTGSKTMVQGTTPPVIDETKVKIPSDFLDAITFEIMMIPVLLPSGYTVDQTTLEKHNREQATWGRVPNDPFTGKSFTDTAKPVANAALKVRIDQFLLRNGTDIGVNSRIVGSKSDHGASSVSSLVLGDNKIHEPVQKSAEEVKTELRSSGNHNFEPPKHPKDVKRVASNRKRKVSPTETATSKRQCPTYSSIPTIDLTGESSNSYSSVVSNDNKNASSRRDHERELSSTLDDALDSALSALPSFSAPGVGQPSRTQNTCIKCDEPFGANTSAYQLPCKHKVCRKCITTGESHVVQCPTCDKVFTKSNIVRVHL